MTLVEKLERVARDIRPWNESGYYNGDLDDLRALL